MCIFIYACVLLQTELRELSVSCKWASVLKPHACTCQQVSYVHYYLMGILLHDSMDSSMKPDTSMSTQTCILITTTTSTTHQQLTSKCHPSISKWWQQINIWTQDQLSKTVRTGGRWIHTNICEEHKNNITPKCHSMI